MHPLRLAWLNLARRRSSTATAVLALGLALGVGGMLLEWVERAYGTLDRREPGIDYIVGPKSNSLSLLLDAMHWTGRQQEVIDYQLVRTVRERIGVPVVVPVAHFAEGAGVPVVGTTLEFFRHCVEARGLSLVEGRWFHPVAAEVVIGSELARRKGLRVGDEVATHAILARENGEPVWDRVMQVVGILPESGLPRDRVILTDLTHARQSNAAAMHAGLMRKPESGRGVTAIWIGIDPRRSEQSREIHDLLHVASGAQVVRVEHEIDRLRRHLGRGEQGAVGLIVLLVVAAGAISGIVLAERFETTLTELAVLRALGMQRRRIATVILLEAWLFGALGVACGATFERLFVVIADAVWSPSWLLASGWPTAALLLLWGSILVVVTAAAIPPLWRLYRWDAHEALAGM
jgi:putative ABC transport system permease protein